MIARCRAQLEAQGEWLPGILTNEHPQCLYGLPLVILDGEDKPKRSSEIFCIAVSDSTFQTLAKKAGYRAILCGRRVA